MSTVFVDMNGATVKFAATQGALATTPTDASAQIVSVALVAVANDTPIEATLTSPAGSKGLPSGASLEVTAYQDWTDATGYCWWTADNDGAAQWFELTIPSGGKFQGQVDVKRADYGGSAAEAPQFTQSLPARNLTPTKPAAAP
jgi:hypothetical protein